MTNPRLFPILLVVALCAACGPSAFDAHAMAAEALRDQAEGLRGALREHHRDTLRREVAQLVREEGESDEAWDVRRLARLAEASEEWRRDHEQFVTAQRAAARASTAYSDTAFRALVGELGDPAGLVAIGTQALSAVKHFADLLRSAGWDELPELPEFLTTFLGVDE